MTAPTEADRKAAEASLETARLTAAAYLPQLLEILTEKAIDPKATPKAVLDAAEFTYKVSGLAKRQEETKTGPTFMVKITLPGQNKEIVIGGGTAEEPKTDEENLLDAVPEYVQALPEETPMATIEHTDLNHDDFDLSDLDE